jgi:lycopene cyclase domain-containing protein
MMEYTVAAAGSALLLIVLDYRLRTGVLRQKRFWMFLGVMYGFKLIVNGYLTWRPVVRYTDGQYLGIRLGTIPLEDFVFGFSLITLSVVLWEYLKRREES